MLPFFPSTFPPPTGVVAGRRRASRAPRRRPIGERKEKRARVRRDDDDTGARDSSSRWLSSPRRRHDAARSNVGDHFEDVRRVPFFPPRSSTRPTLWLNDAIGSSNCDYSCPDSFFRWCRNLDRLLRCSNSGLIGAECCGGSVATSTRRVVPAGVLFRLALSPRARRRLKEGAVRRLVPCGAGEEGR